MPVTLQVVEKIFAGHDPTVPVRTGQASRIMTGSAPVQPAATDWRAQEMLLLQQVMKHVGASLAPDVVLRELAELQEGLGELQDHVARADLIEAAGLAGGGHGALVAGALVDRLSEETPGARRACEHAWDRFDRPKVRRHLREALSAAD